MTKIIKTIQPFEPLLIEFCDERVAFGFFDLCLHWIECPAEKLLVHQPGDAQGLDPYAQFRHEHGPQALEAMRKELETNG